MASPPLAPIGSNGKCVMWEAARIEQIWWIGSNSPTRRGKKTAADFSTVVTTNRRENKLRSQVYNHKLFFHRLGTPQSQDKLIYERPDQKEWLFNAEVTDDGRYLIITVQRGTDPKNRIFYKNLADPNSKVVELLDKADAEYNFIDNEGPVFVFRTNLDAPLGRIISIDTSKPLPSKVDELVPESRDKLEAVSSVGERFVAVYLKDAHSAVKLFKRDGSADGEIAAAGARHCRRIHGKTQRP